ncbi:WD domain-containing protein [Pleomassaria siparia CBS 279.74]|uniref:Pre-rRNA-processing protein IPI3 n=1 Tax=Pleomassaria siparia CBS 279.74 TaxID=1314801 RepID=A0A6G1KAW9_9PLEO|nr:WD domain-containing protein [Pleomassaria siparia CBS 279.74]
MLTEHFVASISAHTKPNTGVTKDAGIFFHEFQPLTNQRHVFKKSVTAPNCLAVSHSHIFAAQSEKAVVHVYSREKGNQEAIVPFPERIHSIALAANDTVLLLGTASGRILSWEVCSGRLVSTSSSHLQPVTSLAVDLTSNYFLSGSTDSMIHVWSLPSILSFSPDASRSPIHTLSTHRGAITSLVCGHSASMANIAVSISQDKSAIVWDYHNGQTLRTYLLPEAPTAVALDPADRAFYIAYEDGSLQVVDLYDEVQQSTPVDTLRDASLSHRPVQPSTKRRFNAESQKLGGASSLGLSWDGTTLVTGHASGKIASWDIAKGNYISTLSTLVGPVTNIQFLAPIGFPNAPEPTFKIHTVVKPKMDTGTSNAGNSLVPMSYSLTMQLTGRLSVPAISATERRKTEQSDFEEALTHPVFPMSMLEESLAELESWNAQPNGAVTTTADFLSLSAEDDGEANNARVVQNSSEMNDLKKQLASLQRIQKVTFSQLAELREENEWFLRREKKRSLQKQLKAKKKLGLANGDDADGDVEMSEDGRSFVSESESNDAATSNSSDEDEDEESDAESQSSE